MSQGGYLVITILALVILAVVVSFTFLDVTLTRQSRKSAARLVQIAMKESDEARKSGESNIDELELLGKVVAPSKIRHKLLP
jgi:uncharacterized membrane protein